MVARVTEPEKTNMGSRREVKLGDSSSLRSRPLGQGTMGPDCLEQLDLSRSDRGIRGEVHFGAYNGGGHHEIRDADTDANGDAGTVLAHRRPACVIV